jgi:hypothetical protein
MRRGKHRRNRWSITVADLIDADEPPTQPLPVLVMERPFDAERFGVINGLGWL